MDEKIHGDMVGDRILPGFRFHPTDEELVGYYLKRKIQHLPLPLELIKQVDIYKFDPWDLPKLAASGEREWYFYCPRDRKYRNSMRPNRVTVAGFWKATGTDRPIYSSDGAECIGLKKSLVFYRGRAAKGIKTDWMMHEFRLPSLPDSIPFNKIGDKTRRPATDSWAICRIFRRTNSLTQRAYSSHYQFSSLKEATASDALHQGADSIQFCTENVDCTAKIASAFQCCDNYDPQQSCIPTSFSAIDIPSYKNKDLPQSKTAEFSSSLGGISDIFLFTTSEASDTSKCTSDTVSMLLNDSLLDSSKALDGIIDCQEPQQQYNAFSVSFPEKMQRKLDVGEDDQEGRFRKKPDAIQVNNQWEAVRSTGFPVSLQANDAWKQKFPLDSTRFLVGHAYK